MSESESLANSLGQRIVFLERQLADDQRLDVVYYRPNGDPVEIHHLTWDRPGHVRLTGLDAQGNECIILAHPASVQLFATVRAAKPDEPKRTIGFDVGNDQGRV
jgi:hypothetical protein